MKTKLTLFTFTFAFAIHLLAAVPLRWNVDVTRVSPVAFDAYHGETLAFEPSFNDGSTPVIVTNYTAQLYWQTNGMGSVYWRTETVTTEGNTATALLAGAFDTGAPMIRGFVAVTDTNVAAAVNYRAAFTVRYRPAPGFTPADIPDMTRRLDFATTRVLNADLAPFPTDADLAAASLAAKSYTDAATNAAVATASADATAKANAAQAAATSTASADATAKANAAQAAATSTASADATAKANAAQAAAISTASADATAKANAALVAAKAYTDAKTPVPLAGRRFDFATMRGMYEAVSNIVQSLGGSVTNFPSFN